MANPTITPAPSLLKSDYYRGPLTTLFSPPASCFHLTKSLANDGLFFGHGADPVVFDPSCYPTAPAGVDLKEITNWHSYYHTPGLCPIGWSTATTFTSRTPGFGEQDWVSLGPETTAGLCCPTGYTYSAFGHLCASSISRQQVVSHYVPSATDGSYVLGSLVPSEFPTPGAAVGNGIPIWWQKLDQAVLAATATGNNSPAVAASTSSLPSPTATATTSSQRTVSPASASSSTEPSNTYSKSKMSTGTKIGLSMGVFFATTALLSLILLLIYRKNIRARYGGGHPYHDRKYVHEKWVTDDISELDGFAVARHSRHRYELQ